MAPTLDQGDIDVGPRYEWVRPLGKGAYGVAVLMRDRLTSEQVAVKFIQRGELVDKNVEREIQNHRRLSAHSNVVKFREVFLTSTHLGIAMEFASGGTLFDQVIKMTRFKEDIARYFFQQLVCGVAWCHSRGVCHRDLKLENTLLDGRSVPRVLICDFGYSKNRDTDSTPKTTVGTPAYVAPEVLSRGTYDGEKADVWSCGVALYTMLVGAYPFQDPTNPSSCRRTVQRIIAVQYTIPMQLRLSEACVDLIRRIFVLDPVQRIALADIQQHPWYLANLPRECQGVTGALASVPPSQTEVEIKGLVQAARIPGLQYGRNLNADSGGSGGLGLSGEIRMEEAMVDLMEEQDYLD